MAQKVLILGAHGRFGRHAAQAFETAGWEVTHFDRRTGNLAQAVKHKDVVVNAWNPPDYSTWHRDLLPLHRRVIDALRGQSTTVVVPGNVYVYGAQPGTWSPHTPHRPTGPLGRMRAEMEAAYRGSGLRTILLRGGDFLDTAPSGNWFDKVMVTSLAKGKLTYPGRLDARHAWAFLPDMTRALVMLAEQRETLPVYADIPFAGYTLTAQQMAEALGPQVTARKMHWWPLQLLAPVQPWMRGLLEMRYLWDAPHALDPEPLAALLPDFRTTPVRDALRQATAHLALGVAAGQPVPAWDAQAGAPVPAPAVNQGLADFGAGVAPITLPTSSAAARPPRAATSASCAANAAALTVSGSR